MKQVTRFAIPILSVFIAFVFVQSLFFKFADAPETQHIFGTLDDWAGGFGARGLFAPTGLFSQYVVGSIELVASILLILGLFGAGMRLLSALGAFAALAVITGAVYFHTSTPLGIEVQGDGGTLFFMACGVWLSALIILIARCGALGRIGRLFRP